MSLTDTAIVQQYVCSNFLLVCAKSDKFERNVQFYECALYASVCVVFFPSRGLCFRRSGGELSGIDYIEIVV